ncbi:group 1 truncated hemoglobin [Methylophilus sp. VKM B-3414]|uniref:group I truncated hemoglobin n=1 Tax=Methylophilus sp. VKM B-3414 TaxID=3076121 RepID=UPI0028C931A7|nr:group 1 truncated hemoglobin [Methylophilus sp. VKM B-3414]MDT7848529.1 group 1 truncated hemoglobin [Methylophilus sp. VKM B-3414]
MRRLIWIGLLLCMAGCTAQPKPDASLFSRIGGLPMLSRLSNQTLDIVSKDPRTARSFEGVKMVTLKQSLTNFLCVKTGGQCEYEGETMKNAHADVHITMAEFEIMVEVLRERMDINGVGTKEKNELLKILAPMKRDVVSD